ncbi:hypothetical protein HK57_00175 [Aspergillus ustus]|uniref:Uncharacterized protein n=1 Tax=Aspergillus ustus TaxID=40382 RepID=A0A0C1E7A3_ASPUT|nr:hypothetical protein HK57_00175 [Aspergillus ustus]
MPPASLPLGGQPASRRAASSRNISFLTILGVIGGGYFLFRSQSPRKGEALTKGDDEMVSGGSSKLGRSKVVSKDDAKAMMGEPAHGPGHVGRSPRQASGREDI